MNQLRDLIVKSFVMERVGHQVARVLSHLRRTVIMVNGEIVQVRARDAKNGAVPVQVIVIDSNQADGGIDSAHRCSVAVEIPRVGLRVAVSAHPGSPNLVCRLLLEKKNTGDVVLYLRVTALFDSVTTTT